MYAKTKEYRIEIVVITNTSSAMACVWPNTLAAKHTGMHSYIYAQIHPTHSFTYVRFGVHATYCL